MRLQRDQGQIWWNFLTSRERESARFSLLCEKLGKETDGKREREREREVEASQRSFGLLKGT